MIRRILSDDESEQMPPPETKKKLTEAQKQLLVRWISEGAEYQPHWSLIPPARPSRPESRQLLVGPQIRSTASSRRSWKRPA